MARSVPEPSAMPVRAGQHRGIVHSVADHGNQVAAFAIFDDGLQFCIGQYPCSIFINAALTSCPAVQAVAAEGSPEISAVRNAAAFHLVHHGRRLRTKRAAERECAFNPGFGPEEHHGPSVRFPVSRPAFRVPAADLPRRWQPARFPANTSGQAETVCEAPPLAARDAIVVFRSTFVIASCASAQTQ